MSENCIWIGLGVYLDQNSALTKYIQKINNYLNEYYGAKLLFENKPPHLNLIDLDIPEQNLEAVYSDLNSIVSKTNRFEVCTDVVEYFDFGLFYLKTEKSEQLLDFHEILVERISKYKGQCICSDYLQSNRKYNAQQKKYLHKYGNPHVQEFFTPHITLGHVKQRSKQELESIRDELIKEFPEELNFTLNHVHIAVQFSSGSEIKGRKFSFK